MPLFNRSKTPTKSSSQCTTQMECPCSTRTTTLTLTLTSRISKITIVMVASTMPTTVLWKWAEQTHIIFKIRWCNKTRSIPPFLFSRHINRGCNKVIIRWELEMVVFTSRHQLIFTNKTRHKHGLMSNRLKIRGMKLEMLVIVAPSTITVKLQKRQRKWSLLKSSTKSICGSNKDAKGSPRKRIRRESLKPIPL